jgi:hypothetical protein
MCSKQSLFMGRLQDELRIPNFSERSLQIKGQNLNVGIWEI